MTGITGRNGGNHNTGSNLRSARRRKQRLASSQSRVRMAALSVAAVSIFASHAADAANTPDTYTGAANGALDTGSNWSATTVPTVSSDALFNGSTSYGTLTLNISPETFGSLNDTNTNAASFTIGGNQTLTLGGGGNLGDGISGSNSADLLYVASGGSAGLTYSSTGGISLAQAGNLDIAGSSFATITTVVSGSNGFTKTGTGTLFLNGNETLTGTIVVSAGTLSLSGAGVGLASGVGVSLYNGATFTFGISNGSTTNSYAGATMTNTITVVGGPNTSATFSGTGFNNGGGTASAMQLLFAGNGNLTWGASGLSLANVNMFASYGGTVTWSNSNGIRFTASSTSVNAPFANINILGAGLSNKTASGTLFVGGLSGNSSSSIANLAVDDGIANTNTTFSGNLSAAGTLSKVGTGTWTLNPSTAYVTATSLNANGGTLLADFSNLATPTNLFLNTSTLGFTGGELYIKGLTGLNNTSQTVGAVTLNVGGGTLLIDPNGGNSTTFAMGTITATASGSALDVNESIGNTTNSIVTTSTTNTNGILSTHGNVWFTNSSGTGFAMNSGNVSGGNIGLYTGATAYTTGGGTGTSTTNYSVNDSQTVSTGATFNTLQVTNDTTGQTLTLGNLSLTTGGILFTGPNAETITGGNISTTTANAGLTIGAFSGNALSVATPISGNGTVTVAGNGTVILTATTSAVTGAFYVDPGATLSVASNTNLGNSTAGALVLDGGTFQANGNFATGRAISIYGGGGTIDITGGNSVTLSGNISNINASNMGPLIKTDSGTLVLSGNNSYGGATIIRGGILSTNLLAAGGTNSGIGSSAPVADALILDGGILQYNSSSAAGSTNRTFTLTANGGGLDSSSSSSSNTVTFSNTAPVVVTGTGNRTFTLSGTNTGANTLAAVIGDPSSGKTSLVKSGGSQWVLTGINTYSGATTVSAGTLALSTASTNSIASSPSINVLSGATLSVSGLNSGTIALGGSQTLTGAGSITGNVSTASGTVIMPGLVTAGSAGAGNLTINGGLTLGGGSIVDFGLVSGNSTANLISLSGGNLTIPSSGTAVTVNLYVPGTNTVFTPGSGNQTYDLIQTAAVTGNLTSEFSIANENSAFSYSVVLNGGYVQLDTTQLAIPGVWAVTNSGNWSNNSNWTNGTAPGNPGDSATFGQGNATQTVTLDANESVGSIIMSSTNSYVIADAGNMLGLNSGNSSIAATITVTAGTANAIQTSANMTSNTTVSVSASDSLSISGNFSGAGNLTVDGAGTLALSGSNSYGPAAGTVGTTLSGGGTLQLGSNTALGAGDLSITGNTTLQAGGNVTVANNVILGSSVNEIVDSQANTFTLSGNISGSTGSLTKIGSGTLVLGNANTYGGSTTISAGVVSISGDGTAGNPGSLGNVPSSATANNVILNGGDLLGTGNFTLNANRGIGIGAASGSASATGLIDAAASQNFTVAGIIASAGNTGTDNLTINGDGGAGTVILAGNNTFTGTTVISGGTLKLGTALALQDSTLNYAGQGGNLSFGSLTAATLGGLTGNQGLALNNGSAAVTLSVGNNNGNATYGGNLSGNGSLTKIGTATQTLNGISSFTGGANINAGTLTVTTGGSVGLNGSTVNGGAINVNVSSAALSVTGGLVGASSMNVGGHNIGGQLVESSGNVTVTGTITTSDNDSTSIQILGGNLTAGGLTIQRQGTGPVPSVTTGIPASAVNTSIYVDGSSAMVSLGALNIATSNSSASFREDLGSVTVTGETIIGEESGAAAVRWSYLNVNGGNFTSTNGGGIEIAKNNVNGNVTTGMDAELYITGGVVTTPKVAFGASTDTVANNAYLTLNGGTLYIGTGGMVNGNASVNSSNIFLNAGTLGATGNWTSSLNATLVGNTTIQAGDSTGTAYNITLSGNIGGAGGLTKTGNGTLTLSSSSGNFYSGLTTVSAGTLNINGTYALGGGFYSGIILNGGTLQYVASMSPTAQGGGDISNFGGAKPVTIGASGGTIDLNGNPVSYASTVGNSGAGALTITDSVGGGSLTLNGQGTWSGGTNISAGTVFANNATSSLGGGNVTVQSGATLSGNGSTGAGAVTILAGGKITGGLNTTTAGILHTDLTVNGNATIASRAFGITGSGNTTATAGTDFDQIADAAGTTILGASTASPINVQLTLPNGNATANFNPTSSYTFPVLTFSAVSLPNAVAGTPGIGTVTVLATDNGTGAPTVNSNYANLFTLDTTAFASSSLGTSTNGSFALELVVTGSGSGDLEVDYAGTPEPGTTILVLGGAVPMLMGRRRRRRIDARSN